jgi:hypothetical protein
MSDKSNWQNDVESPQRKAVTNSVNEEAEEWIPEDEYDG